MDLLTIENIMLIINVISLLFLGVGYFRSKFTIVDLETWNTIVEFYNEHAEDENDNCGGGVGFYIGNELEEDEDDDNEEDVGNHKKVGF